MSRIRISRPQVEETLRILRGSGARGREGIALWLGHRRADHDVVERVYQPIHRAAADFFHIPPEGMRALMAILGDAGLRVVAQVHTHPAEAFHSAADDKWAIVRHRGALSLVLPWFASRTTAATFLTDSAVFELDAANNWVELNGGRKSQSLEIL